jgi:tetratricopeptide (TPR) repeat protein
VKILVWRVSQNRPFAAAGVLALMALGLSDCERSRTKTPNAPDNAAYESTVLNSPEYHAVVLARLATDLAPALHRQADWEKVLTATKALVGKYPSSGFAYARLGDVYEAIGSPDEALEAYREAVKLHPDLIITIRPVAHPPVCLASLRSERVRYCAQDSAPVRSAALDAGTLAW